MTNVLESQLVHFPNSLPKKTVLQILKFSLAGRLRGQKQRKLNDHVYSFLLFVFYRFHYQAELEVFPRMPYLELRLLAQIACFIDNK